MEETYNLSVAIKKALEGYNKNLRPNAGGMLNNIVFLKNFGYTVCETITHRKRKKKIINRYFIFI